MGYSATWNEAAPVGSVALASDLDTVIQQLKRDIRERMDPLFRIANLNTTSTSDVSLATFSLPANTLQDDGAQIRIVAVVRAATQNCVFHSKFGATDIGNRTVLLNTAIVLEDVVVRTSVNTQRAAAVGAANASVAPAELLSGAVTLDFRGSVTAGGTLTIDSVEVWQRGVRP